VTLLTELSWRLSLVDGISIAIKLQWVLSWREVNVPISASFSVLTDVNLFGICSGSLFKNAITVNWDGCGRKRLWPILRNFLGVYLN
jgi:hypothetical protein